MASILNKSTHPVFVKKVSLLTWSLRDEIEEIIAKRLIENENPNIEDIKSYYSSKLEDEEAVNFERLVPKEKFDKGEMILADVNMQSILLFCEKRYTVGQNIGIQFNIPNPFILTCRVESVSQIGSKSRVIGIDKAKFRVACIFEHHYEHEKDALRVFLKSVEPEVPPSPHNMKSPKNPDDEEDDFSDLGL